MYIGRLIINTRITVCQRRDEESAVAEPRRFEFGVEMMAPFPDLTWAESARELERLGYATLFAPDHLDEGYGPVTAMATAAMATESLRVATAVFAADFRHPALLARELASIDQLSAGRLEVGIGAGYQVNDYRGAGFAMDPPKVRVDRLIEHVAVLRGLFAGEPFTFAGEHYQIDSLQLVPRPCRPGGPPLFIAGGGRRMLTFAAAHADIVGVNSLLPTSQARSAAAADALPASVDRKLGWIRDAAGDRFDQLTLHAWIRHAHVTDRAGDLAAPLAESFGAPAGEVLDSPVVLIGTVDEITERLLERRARWGFSYFTIQQPAAAEFAPVVARLAGA
jgi:probable F420-dependent oxidoreductase